MRLHYKPDSIRKTAKTRLYLRELLEEDKDTSQSRHAYSALPIHLQLHMSIADNHHPLLSQCTPLSDREFGLALQEIIPEKVAYVTKRHS
jgi:hypothetical protein